MTVLCWQQRFATRVRSLRFRLLALVLIPLLLLTGTVIYLSAQWSTRTTYAQLFNKVSADLRVAENIFERMQSDRQAVLASLADSAAFLDSLQNSNRARLAELIDTQRMLGGFDYLNLLSADGSQRLVNGTWVDWQLPASPLTDAVLNPPGNSAKKQAATGIEIYQRELWQLQSEVPENKLLLPLIDTPRAKPTDRTEESNGMIIRSLHTVRDHRGNSLALLEGGLLLNQNFGFVDEIRDLVYGPGALAEGSRGTVTVFLNDVRISTNVPTSEDTRALGTRVSAEVRQTVLENGEQWIDRAFVVNDWYISAYLPITDVHDKRVGMLYAGFLEAPFRQELDRGIRVLAGLVLAGSLLAVLAAILGAKAIYRPIEEMAKVARATAVGKHRRMGALNTHDEISELALQFDLMLDRLQAHRVRIERDAEYLEHKVHERTLELEQKNVRLEESIHLLNQTRQQLATAEKLAAIGQLTAGVAHEINNPTAVILGNLDVVIDEMGDAARPVQTELDLIMEQVYRIRSITDSLLQYSRASRHYGDNTLPAMAGRERQAQAVLDDVVREALTLVQHELQAKSVTLRTELSSPGTVAGEPQELQSVIVNILTNAIQAVDSGGDVLVRTRISDHDNLAVDIIDNGCGIAEDYISRLFDPFFTMGKAGGTGLGLSLSDAIVRRYQGSIQVSSGKAGGATFSVLLPAVACKGQPAGVSVARSAERVG